MPSARSKTPRASPAPKHNFSFGSLVFVKGDKDRHSARGMYIIVSITNHDGLIGIRKFSGSNYCAKIYYVKPSDLYPASASFDHADSSDNSNVRE